MDRRLLPLNALKTLEAAGRNMSFSRAADELHVTPGAISRQVRHLEDILGFPLFERTHSEVKLTPECRVYVESLSDVFEQMERATRRLVSTRRQRSLHIHTAITFTLRWLVPRLVTYHARYPKQDIRLSTLVPSAAELIAASSDISIQIESGAAIAAASPALLGHRLVDVDLLPVCSPHLLGRHALCGNPAGFADYTLLHSSARPRDWADWLTAAGIGTVDPELGMRFESSSLAYHAAVEGIGIAMGMRALVEPDLQSGRLVVPYDFTLESDTGFYLIYSPAAMQTPQVTEFRDWILAEANCRST